MYFWNPVYMMFARPGLLLAMWAQARIRSAYGRYLRVRNAQGITGVEAAEQLLRSAGLGRVSIEGTPGELTDHYDPRTRTMRLSQTVARSNSLAAISIVAHEVGHAVQHATNYAPLRLRSGIVPMVTLSSYVGPILFFIGLMFGSTDLAYVGLFLFSATAFFALLTLPVEINASQRALQMLSATGMVTDVQERSAARQVLNAAAWTYVAALVQVISTLLYYVFLLSGSSRRRR